MLAFLRRLLGVPEIYIPDKVPEDEWEQLFILAEIATSIKLAPLSEEHFNLTFPMLTDDVNELLFRLDRLTTCLDTRADVPSDWKARRKELKEVSFLDYCYDVRSGYRDPQAVLEVMLQKLSVIHYLLESRYPESIDEYRLYIRRQFSGVVSDVSLFLDTCVVMRQN